MRPFHLHPPPRRADALEQRRLVESGGLKVVVERLGCPMVRRDVSLAALLVEAYTPSELPIATPAPRSGLARKTAEAWRCRTTATSA